MTDTIQPAGVKQSPLRRLRFEAGDPRLSDVSESAAKLGKVIDRTLISRLEKGRRTMSYEHAAALGPVYGVTAGDLLKAMAEWYEARAPKRRKRSARTSPLSDPSLREAPHA